MQHCLSHAHAAPANMAAAPSFALRLQGSASKPTSLFAAGNFQAFGYSPEDFLRGSLHWTELICPEDLPAYLEATAQNNRAKASSYTLFYRIAARDGRLCRVRDDVTVTRGDDGGILYADSIVTGCAAPEAPPQAQQGHSAGNRQQVLDAVLEALQHCEPGNAIVCMLRALAEYMPLGRAALYENEDTLPAFEWAAKPSSPSAGGTPPIQAPGLRAALQNGEEWSLCAGDGLPSTIALPVQKGGREDYGFLWLEGAPAHWQEGRAFLHSFAKLVGMALLRKANEETITSITHHDQLTGLTNRYRLEAALSQAITRAEESRGHGYVLFVDLDDFNVINEGYGHNYGDALLVQLAGYMRGSFGNHAQLFRFGGDEFVVLLDAENASELSSIVEELLGRGRHPWQVLDREFYCTLSIGAVRYPGSGADTAGDIIKYADIAIHSAKGQGKNNCVLFNETIDNASRHRAETEKKMREAIENDFDGFAVYYQPIVNASGDMIGAEALIRWKDAEGNIISPGEFVPLAEYLGLIVPLGEFVLRTAAEECRRINEYLPDFTINVNVSIRQFQQENFLARVEDILNSVGVDYANMVLEVTEGMMVKDIEHMSLLVDHLRALGIRIAMDDFGTGYSSLNNMRKLPLDIIKIDRSFITDVTHDAYSQSFIRLITDLSHSMGRKVCVEGVETAIQYSYCAECRVDCIQGYYFYKPMPNTEFQKALLKASLQRRGIG